MVTYLFLKNVKTCIYIIDLTTGHIFAVFKPICKILKRPAAGFYSLSECMVIYPFEKMTKCHDLLTYFMVT